MTTSLDAPKLPRKIAILGNASVSLADAPYDDLTWKIWDMSNNVWLKKRFDLWFEIHTPEVLDAKKAPKVYIDFLNECGTRLVAGAPSPLWPNAMIYPIADVVNRFGDYFTCSVAYMIAYALYLHEIDIKAGGPGVSHLGFWGIDMAIGEEYTHQKANAEYWIGMARGMGIDCHVAPESPICRTNAMYGFDNPKLSREFTDRLRDLDECIKKDNEMLVHLKVAVSRKELDILEQEAVKRALKQICDRWAL